MTFTSSCVVLPGLFDEFLTRVLSDQGLCNADCARCILDIDDRTVVVRFDFDGCVRRRCRRAADQQRKIESQPLHLFCDQDHFIERRCDQAGQTDERCALAFRRLENFLARHHDAEIYNLEVITLQHDANDVLANIVYIAFDGGHDDPAVRFDAAAFLLLYERHKVTNRFFHHAR